MALLPLYACQSFICCPRQSPTRTQTHTVKGGATYKTKRLLSSCHKIKLNIKYYLLLPVKQANGAGNDITGGNIYHYVWWRGVRHTGRGGKWCREHTWILENRTCLPKLWKRKQIRKYAAAMVRRIDGRPWVWIFLCVSCACSLWPMFGSA